MTGAKRKPSKAVPGSFCARGPDFFKDLDAESHKGKLGLVTGYPGLDAAFGGLRGFNILGGLPGGLKTSFALQLAARVLKDEDVGVLMFSAEMRAPRTMKMICSLTTQLPRPEIERGALAAEENASKRADFERFINEEGRRFVLLDSDDDLSTDALPAHAKRVRDELGTSKLLVIADSLQYLALRQPPSSHWSEKGRLDRFTGALMEASDEGRICVLAISHLPKSKSTREADVFQFLGSAGIDYCADATMTLDWERAPRTGKRSRLASATPIACPISLRICKNRWGAPDVSIEFLAVPATGRFTEVGDEEGESDA